MNKVAVLGILLLLSQSVVAQKVTVSEQSEKVKGESAEGYATELEGKKDAVNQAWLKSLREIGKVRQGTDPVTVTEPNFNGLGFPKGTIYAIVTEKGSNTRVWLGIRSSEWESNDVKRIKNELEKAVYRFGVKYYRDKIQAQIDEAQQALDAVEKQKSRIANQTKDLELQLANNVQEKVLLDKSIATNKVENQTLTLKLQNNTHAQDSLTQAGVQIEKVRQMHLDRQKSVK